MQTPADVIAALTAFMAEPAKKTAKKTAKKKEPPTITIVAHIGIVEIPNDGSWHVGFVTYAKPGETAEDTKYLAMWRPTVGGAQGSFAMPWATQASFKMIGQGWATRFVYGLALWQKAQAAVTRKK